MKALRATIPLAIDINF